MSNEGKGQAIFLSVIGIATLLVAIIGATFAYFTTQISGDAQKVEAQTGTVGKVNFTAQPLDVPKMLPGKTSDEKEVTVTLGQSDFDVNYSCTLEVTGNEVVDMYLNVSGDNAEPTANGMQISPVVFETVEDGKELTPAGAAQKITIASGTLKSGETKTMKYSITFKETGKDQDSQQGARFRATVYCGLDSAEGVYYNNANPSGTTTKPSAQ